MSVAFNISLHESGTWQLLATNAALNDNGMAEFDTLELQANGVTKATLHLDKKLGIPEKLLEQGSPRKLITLPQAVDEDIAALHWDNKQKMEHFWPFNEENPILNADLIDTIYTPQGNGCCRQARVPL